MCIAYSVSSCKLATSFSTFQSSSSQVKTVNHYEFYAVFQFTEHQLQENILHHVLYYHFL